MSETELLQRIRQRQTDALAEYIDGQRQTLLAIVHRKMSDGLKNKVDPEDIVQEVAATAMQSLPEMDFDDRDPFVWLCHLIDRRVVDAHRRFNAKKRAASQEIPLSAGDDAQGGVIDMLIASVTSPSMAFSRKRQESMLWSALRQLPDEQQQALKMRYVQNLPSKEIAAQLGRSDGAVRVMLTRAIKRLEQLLGANS